MFDSGFVLGDGVWEGLRLIDGRIAFLDKHFDRLWDGAKMLRIDIGLTRDELARRLFDVIEANGMREGVHIRLMMTRGVKRSPYQDPRLTIGGATIVVIPEWKLPKPEMLARGLNLFTVHIRRTGPAEQDAHTTLLDDLFLAGPWDTIAIGDGGNEIGMGALPRTLIGVHVAHGEAIACVTPAAHLILAGVSHWGAYALLGGLAVIRPAWRDSLLECLDPTLDRAILEATVRDG
ncbi:MAG: glutamate cyclase domain-containing protein, partial [Roseiarcus sp.]